MINQKSLILDIDLRKPRFHSIFKVSCQYGLTDYLFWKSDINQIIKTGLAPNLDMITAATLTSNSAEIVSSPKLEEYYSEIENRYDFIFVDFPPIIAVADAGILSHFAYATVLVVSTNQKRLDLMEHAIDTLNSMQGHFVGVLFNNFSVRNGYG